MEAAAKRYFNIPELADALGQRLDKGTISSLVATSRQLKTLFEPWLYHELVLSYLDVSGRLLNSTGSVSALARNVQHVRWLMCDQEEIGFLFNCLLTGEEQKEDVQKILPAAAPGLPVTETLSTWTTSRPRWVPQLEAPPSSITSPIIIVPLLPMHCLTYLELNLMPLGSLHWPSYRLPTSASSAHTTLRQTCWIIQQCPNLLALELVHVPVQDFQEMQLLVATIHGVSQLQSLHLFVRAEERVWSGGFERLFFGLAESVKVCKLFSSDPMPEELYEDLEDGNSPAEVEEGEAAAHQSNIDNQDQHDIPQIHGREEPLVNLTKFVAWEMERSKTMEEILAVFDHCPNIQILKVPSVFLRQKELTSLATSISKRCPHLRTLSLLDNADGPLLVRLMEVMPAHTLEKVKLNSFEFTLHPSMTRRIFANHAKSLRTVDLRNTMDVSSKNILIILELCEALEEFKKHPDPNSGDLYMTLKDAVSVTWGCRRIRHLELTIGMMEIPQVPYYARLDERPLVLSDEEQRLFTKLEKFYTQLGNLTELEYLDLRVVESSQDDDDNDEADHTNDAAAAQPSSSFNNYSSDDGTAKNLLPGLLSLPNNDTRRPGYLHLLSGWTKLKELRGSVCVDTEAGKATVGDKEVDWFIEHWPALERVRFFVGTVVLEEFRKLEEARPNLMFL